MFMKAENKFVVGCV